MNYSEYIKSEHWRLLRGAKLQVSPRCEKCGGKEELEVHHVIYASDLHLTKISELKTLCHHCHILEHAKQWVRIYPKKEKPVKKDKAARLKARIARLTRRNGGETLYVLKLKRRLQKLTSLARDNHN